MSSNTFLGFSVPSLKIIFLFIFLHNGMLSEVGLLLIRVHYQVLQILMPNSLTLAYFQIYVWLWIFSLWQHVMFDSYLELHKLKFNSLLIFLIQMYDIRAFIRVCFLMQVHSFNNGLLQFVNLPRFNFVDLFLAETLFWFKIILESHL